VRSDGSDGTAGPSSFSLFNDLGTHEPPEVVILQSWLVARGDWVPRGAVLKDPTDPEASVHLSSVGSARSVRHRPVRQLRRRGVGCFGIERINRINSRIA